MSNQEGSTSSSVVVELQQEQHSFLTGAVDLKRLMRDVSRQSKPAVEALTKLLESKDEKIRLTAATKLLELHVSVAKEINTDHIQRLIAEIKYNRGGAKALIEVDNDRPLVDFSTIREVG